ncbi:hypothetical protein ABEB36_004379 [Hypothenemus hampei]|uniref:Copper transport protein n=1 Tax=Hypothenemus hampei TaxID=57062 RepID=A0ABD1F337_HYPHA
MDMSFFFSTKGMVLFKHWTFNSYGGLIGSMIAIFAFAFTYEAVKFFRGHLLYSANLIRERNRESGEERFTQLTILSKSHLVQTLFFVVQMILSYFLMLIFMTYNAWLCIAVIAGFSCGYFVFGWRTSGMGQISEEHCS